MNKSHIVMITDYDIIKKSYHREFDLITKLYLRETFPHSLIFHGPKESGKRKFVDIFIKSIYKELNIDQFVFEINSDENIAMVDDVRNLINQCNLTNSVDNINKSFLVINNLELLNKNSVIALLKTIEEPPPNTILILITHNLKLIPKTIQSRCVKIKFNPHQLLASKYENKSEQENLLISDGSPSIYNLLQSNDGNLIKVEIKKILESQTFKYVDFENFFLKISNNFDIYLPLVINLIFHNLKLYFKSNICDLNKKQKILTFLDFVRTNFRKDLFLDKKKILFLIFNEYFSLELSK